MITVPYLYTLLMLRLSIHDILPRRSLFSSILKVRCVGQFPYKVWTM